MRIRDPVTSKIRTLYLSDNQLDELSERHEQDKNKIKNLLNNNNNNNENTHRTISNSVNDSRNNSPSKTQLDSPTNSQLKTVNVLNGVSGLQQQHHNSNNGIILKNHKTPVDLGRSKIMEEYDRQKQEDEEMMERLMERHKTEKSKVNQFDGPYVNEDLHETQNSLINNNNNLNTEIPVE